MGGAGPIIGVHCYFENGKCSLTFARVNPSSCARRRDLVSIYSGLLFLSFFLSFFLLLEIIGRSVAVAVATHRDHQHELANSVINILKLESIV